MLYLRALLYLVLFISPSLLSAGAWPRASGETFLSYSGEFNLDDPFDRPFSLFAERGLDKDLTLGLDVGGQPDGVNKAIAFLRWPVASQSPKIVTAIELGLGLADGEFALRPGWSLGRGFEVRNMSGWLAVDMRGLVFGPNDGRLETDLTLGLKPTKRSIVIFQVQAGLLEANEPYARLAPSFVYQLSPGRHVKLGATAGVLNEEVVRLKLGMWLQF